MKLFVFVSTLVVFQVILASPMASKKQLTKDERIAYVLDALDAYNKESNKITFYFIYLDFI